MILIKICANYIMDRVRAIRQGQNVPARQPRRGVHIPVHVPIRNNTKTPKIKSPKMKGGSNPDVKSWSPYEMLLPSSQPKDTWAIPTGYKIAN